MEKCQSRARSNAATATKAERDACKSCYCKYVSPFGVACKVSIASLNSTYGSKNPLCFRHQRSSTWDAITTGTPKAGPTDQETEVLGSR